MNDDSWSRELARVAREEKQAEKARLDERWDRLSAGELSDEEEAELRALAATSEEGGQAYEAFRPLGPEFQARVVAALQAGNAPAPVPAPTPATSEPAPPRRILPFPRWRATAGGWLAAAASAAAALVLLLRVFTVSPALPMYAALELSGDIQKMRGAPAGDVPVFAPGSTLKLRLVPDTAVSGKIAVRGFLARGEEIQLWKMPEPLVSEGGVVQVEGTIGRDIAIEPGLWTVWIVVGRPGKLPDAAGLRARLAQSRTATQDWTARSARLRVRRESG